MGRDFDFAEFHAQSVAEQIARSEQSDWLLAGDCSFLPKSGKQTYGKGIFWSGSSSKSEPGLEIEGYALINPNTKEAYMVDVEQTPSDLSSKEGSAEDYTRVDHYVDHLRRVIRRYYWVRYVALDGYYTKHKVLSFFDQAEDCDMIGKLRKDADLKFYLDREKAKASGVHIHGNKKYEAKFDHEDPMSQRHLWKLIGTLEEDADIELYQAKMYSPYYKRDLNVVLCWHQKEQKHILLFSTDLELAGLKLVQYYKSRFQIEFLFRDAKQHAGLNHAQVRDAKKLDFHFNFCFANINLGRIVAREQGQAAFAFNNAKRLGYNNLLLEKFIANSGIDPELPEIRLALQKTAQFGLMSE
ncbi:MAG: transposase [Bacteroidota bacterium]